MKTELVSITQPLNSYLKSHNIPLGLSPEGLTVYIARVSSPRIDKTEKIEGLLKYCLDNHHWSVFEHITITAEVVTSIAIATQILRHRSFCFQQFSQRYAEVTELEPVELRKQGITNRQSSTEVFNPELELRENSNAGHTYILPAKEAIDNCLRNINKLYETLIESGVAKECARMLLPQCTQTTIYMTTNLRNWIHYFAQRCDDHAQLEHQEVAYSIRNQMKEYFPIISNVLQW